MLLLLLLLRNQSHTRLHPSTHNHVANQPMMPDAATVLLLFGSHTQVVANTLLSQPTRLSATL
jgi:hypothetical protein